MRDGKSSIDGEFFGENGGGDFVQSGAAVFLGNSAAHQAELGAFPYKLGHQSRFLVFQIFRERQDLFQDKFFRGLSDELAVNMSTIR